MNPEDVAALFGTKGFKQSEANITAPVIEETVIVPDFLMTTVTEDRGRQNIYAIEPPIEIMEVTETTMKRLKSLTVAWQCWVSWLQLEHMPLRVSSFLGSGNGIQIRPRRKGC